MIIFKFGGSSIKDVQSIKNVVSIISKYKNDKLIVVFSAIHKYTNRLENVTSLYFSDKSLAISDFDIIIEEHKSLINNLFDIEAHNLFNKLNEIQTNIKAFINTNQNNEYTFVYDQIVSVGEILSSLILSTLLEKEKLDCTWINSLNLIKTDNNYSDANVDFELSKKSILTELNNIKNNIIVTMGFVGGNSDGFYTTLGREGSDYTASILAFSTNSKEITIWKDVNGIYTCDPNKYVDATLIKKISYNEAIEMTYYGAQVIHPKTIKPIQNTNCNLIVRSFIDINNEGTTISNFENIDYNPIVIIKENQYLYTFSVKDFSFLNESNLGKIINTFGEYSLRINMMQNTAIKFIVLTDEKIEKNNKILDSLSEIFEIKVIKNLKLLTIRHYNQEIIDKYTSNTEIYLSQKGNKTIQFLIK